MMEECMNVKGKDEWEEDTFDQLLKRDKLVSMCFAYSLQNIAKDSKNTRKAG